MSIKVCKNREVIAIGTILVSTGSCVPERRLTNEMLTKMVDTSDEWIVQRTGIRERRIAVNQTTAELAITAAKHALADTGITAQEIDIIIACTATPDSYTPSIACRVQAELQAQRAVAFDLSAACSGFVYATDVVDSYFRAGKAKTALVVCAETLSRIVDYTDRTVCCLFGDGAGAAVYQWSETKDGILQTFMGADGSRGDALLATALPVEDPLEQSRNTEVDRFLHMNGKEVFRFAARTVPEAIDCVLKQAGVTIDEIDWIVPHQANLRIIDVICRRYGLAPEQVYVNLERYGNTSSASIPLCLDEMRRNGLLLAGQLIIFVGFGGGLTYGAVLIRI
ncbi:MAG: beta-ketoacyl-ACP synthase III [Eubacteriales bacterium]|nr:beta-ketoacyl-ACP synthase III [Eubacteriales bacterium]